MKWENFSDHIKRFQIKERISVDYHIVEQCNLNCKGCLHFSPIAKTEYISLQRCREELTALRVSLERRISGLKLLGGEPLLHPNLVQIMQIARNIFPDEVILIVTNGILLQSMDSEFWKACHEFNIIISISEYPIRLNLEAIKAKALEKKVELTIFAYRNDFWKWEIGNKQSFVWRWNYNFFYCPLSNNCHTYRERRLYTCAIAAHVHHFEKYFNTPINYDMKENSIPVIGATQKEILRFLAKPIPMCGYCKIRKNVLCQNWGISQKSIDEWT